MYKKTISLYFEENLSITLNSTDNAEKAKCRFNNANFKTYIKNLGLTDAIKTKEVFKEKWVKQSDGTYKKDVKTDKLGDFHSVLYNGIYDNNVFNLIKNIVDGGKSSAYLLLIVERKSRMVLKYGTLISQYNPIIRLTGTTSIVY